MNMLRSIREKKGLTIGQLAARASIPTRILAEYEEGRQPIPLPHAKLIAKALWVRIEDLMPPGGGAPAPLQSQPTAQPAVQSPRPESRPPQDQQTPRQTPATPTLPPAPPELPRPRDAHQGQQNQVASNQRTPPPQADVRPYRSGEGSMPPVQTQAPTQAPRPGAGAGAGGGSGQSVRKVSDGRTTRPARPPAPPPKIISEGQIEELLRLGQRLEMEQAQVEERTGKALSELTRIEAKEWIKRFRETLEETSPGGRVSFGQWPGSHEDREASYLAQQREASTTLQFKLFNGEQFRGQLVDFTPYTITLKLDNGEEIVLRKLAIVYYRQSTGSPDTQDTNTTRLDPLAEDTQRLDTSMLNEMEPSQDSSAAIGDQTPVEAKAEPPVLETASQSKPATRKRKSKTEVQPPPLADTGIESDRVRGPEDPEIDNMDEDRGI